MNRLLNRLSILALPGLLAACGTSATSVAKYDPAPIPATTTFERTINKPSPAVWKAINTALGKEASLKVTNRSVPTRTITLTFGSAAPQQYIDCGNSERTVTHSRVGSTPKTYKYATAEPTTYMNVQRRDGSLWSIERKPELTGTAKITLVPRGNTTIVRASADYAFVVTVKATPVEPAGAADERKSDPVKFTSAQPGSAGDDAFKTTCATKGTFERKLLDLAGK
ncbi:MAG: hypothetical protein AB7P50_21135 [Alphaproteobacteria bacterium]